jgi:hypothetical protein
VLFEVIRNIFHLQNNGGMEMMNPVALEENNTLLDTNKRQIRIKS